MSMEIWSTCPWRSAQLVQGGLVNVSMDVCLYVHEDTVKASIGVYPTCPWRSGQRI